MESETYQNNVEKSMDLRTALCGQTWTRYPNGPVESLVT